jgi:RNA polymerase sigma-70 factor (ECF subfamily)
MNKQDTTVTENITDNDIISRILTGEKELYALLVRKYNQRLYRIAMSIVNNDAETEDIMQVSYIKAYENLDKFGFKSTFGTWLTRILINESLLRKKKRQRSIQLNEIVSNNMNPQQKTETPLTSTLNIELKMILEESINQLPEKYRTVFVMREIENLNVAETQECLDLSEANVKVRLNRAKALLRDSLSRYYQKEDIFHFHLSRCEVVTRNVMREIGDDEWLC